MEKIFTGDAWSSDEDMAFYYRITLTKENAQRIVKLMDTYKAVKESNKELDLHELVAWDDSVTIFTDEAMNDSDEQLCDVCKVRADVNGVVWELKDKYCAMVYETMDLMRSDIEEVANS